MNVFYGSTYFRGFLVNETANGRQLSAAMPPKLIQKIVERRGRQSEYYFVRGMLTATFNLEKDQALKKVFEALRNTAQSETNTQKTEIGVGTMMEYKWDRSQPVHGYVELLSMPGRCCYIGIARTTRISTLEGCVLEITTWMTKGTGAPSLAYEEVFVGCEQNP